MRIGRCLPPAAAPIFLRDLLHGCIGLFREKVYCDRFIAGLRDHFLMPHVFLVSSGKAALTLILQAVSELYPERNEVVIPAYDCFSVPSAIVKAGLKVRLCDIDPATLDFESRCLQRILADGKKILCIMPTHFFGIATDMDRLQKAIAGLGVVIVEDAAQAMGGLYGREKLGTIGDVGFFSLGRGKAFSTVEGGIIMTKNSAIAAGVQSNLSALPVYGAKDKVALLLGAFMLWLFLRPMLFWFPHLLPFVKMGETVFDPDFTIRKMCGVQAGLARHWRRKLDAFAGARKRVSCGWIERLPRIPHIRSINTRSTETAALIRYPIMATDDAAAETIVRRSIRCGLGITGMYPQTVDTIRELGLRKDETENPGAQACARHLLTFPNHSFVKPRDLSRIERLLSAGWKN